MAQFIRTKKLTDTAYSPTLAISEPTRRAEVDGSIQEISDILYSNANGKGASQVGLENNPYATVQLLADGIKGAAVGFVPMDGSVTQAKLATDVKKLNSNIIINGGFDVWQRNTVFSNPQNSYTADRWVVTVDNATGATYNVEKSTADKEASSFGLDGVFRFSTVVNGSLTIVAVEQRLENVKTLQGKAATVKFKHRFATTPKNITVYFIQNFGSGGSSQVVTTIVPTILGSANADFTDVSGTVVLPSISGKTIGINSYLSIVIQLNAPSVGEYVDIIKVKLEEGSIATDWQTETLGDVLNSCMNTTLVIPVNVLDVIAYVTTSLNIVAIINLTTPLRANPTIALGGTILLQHLGTLYTKTVSSVVSTTLKNGKTCAIVEFSVSDTGGLVAHNSVRILNNSNAVFIDSEL